MKRIFFLGIAGLAAASAALTSCDSVSEPDRLVPAEIVPQRAVLIEEFTGQDCRNCPDGHAALKDIIATLGDSVVAVGIHASALAFPPPLGLKTETGEEYYKAAGSPALPSAVIDMATPALQVAEWGSYINHLIMDPTPFTVIADAEVSSDGKTYDIDVAFSAGDDFQGKLLVWVVENDIVGIQNNYGTYIMDYVHNHVFRAAVNGTWGEDVTLKSGTPQYKTYSIEMQKDWNPEHIHAVAFLYNDGGVMQVTQTKH